MPVRDPKLFKREEFHFSAKIKLPQKVDTYGADKLVSLLLKELLKLAKNNDFSSFSIGFSWGVLSQNEEQLQELRRSVQHSLVSKLSKKLSKKVDFSSAEAHFLVDLPKKTVFLRLLPVFIEGKYNKFSREIAQSDYFCRKCAGNGCWYCNDTGLFCKDSIESIFSRACKKLFRAKGIIFHGAGREDMDVLMLGTGRPFIVEIVCPQKRFSSLKVISSQITKESKKLVKVNGLKYCSQKEVSPLKDAHREKIYSAIVECSSIPNLNLLPLKKKIFLVQETPHRIKRKAFIQRKKEVTILKAKKLRGAKRKNKSENEKEFVVELLCSHGTYVKEFISGDEKRTTPSLSSLLGIECDCKQLDVKKIL